MLNKQYNNKGFIAILVSFLILLIMLSIGVASSKLIINQTKAFNSFFNSQQSYFMAESGIEDALLRIRRSMSFSFSYNLVLENVSTSINISEIIGGASTIKSIGNSQDNFRQLEVVNSLGGDEVQFFFGAQVGDGGLVMANNSKIVGNVFSNGDAVGTGLISGSIQVAKSGNRLENITVGGDARVHTCQGANITGALYATVPGDCSSDGGSFSLPSEISPQPFPISDEQILGWKEDLTEGDIYVGDYTVSGFDSFGPLKIEGNLVLENSAHLELQGNVWITGDIIMNNSTTVSLSDDYGSCSGILMADGIINIKNNTILRGNSFSSSYLLVLTTSSANPAIYIKNNAEAGVFFASNGFIEVSNNVALKEITAYGLTLSNNVLIEYDIGLANLFFTGGPSSGWKIESWRESF